VARNKRNVDDMLVVALACGATVENAAQSAQVSPRTAHRRLSDPAFKGRVRIYKAEMVQRIAGMLTAGSLEAIKKLLGLVQDPQTPPSVLVGAVRTLLEFGIRVRESADLEQRLAIVEQQLKEKAHGAS
jgi:hypothetical protein